MFRWESVQSAKVVETALTLMVGDSTRCMASALAHCARLAFVDVEQL